MICALIKELQISARIENKIDTIYFGGGTPSILSTDDIKKLLDTAYQFYNISQQAEITLEANPDDINEIRLKEWKSIGINRLSIGVQSFNDADLHWMNRVHNADQALNCIKQVKDAGFKNFSVDLIYGTPTLSDTDWKTNVETIINLDVPHISCYALTVEANTALQKMISLNKKEEVDSERSAFQFLLLMTWMQQAGYEHYEISNFAKPGYRSKHNSSYWQGKSYIGIGPSAHSFDINSRRWNVSNNSIYIQSLQRNIIPYEEELLSDVQKLNEYIMTSIRTIEGIDLGYVEKNFGQDMSCRLQAESSKWEVNAQIKKSGDKIILTNEGKLFADGIAADLFVEEKINVLQI